jgi:hypothetical protein
MILGVKPLRYQVALLSLKINQAVQLKLDHKHQLQKSQISIMITQSKKIKYLLVWLHPNQNKQFKYKVPKNKNSHLKKKMESQAPEKNLRKH